jgi:hypothetical protein
MQSAENVFDIAKRRTIVKNAEQFAECRLIFG